MLTYTEYRHQGTHLAGSRRATPNGVRSVSGSSSFQQSSIVGIGAHVQQTSTTNTEQRPSPAFSHPRTDGYHDHTCAYHSPIIEMGPTNGQQGHHQSPMDRFLAEGPSEQSALHVRADTGQLVTSRGCTCYREMEGESRR